MNTTEFLHREIRRAEISLSHAQRKPNTPEEELRGLRDKIACLEEALTAVQRRCLAEKPMTLEELRQMDGKPVLFISLKDGRKKWRVVQSIEKLVEVVKVICFTDDGGETVESYGKTWLAYASEPPCLDRSAWTAEWIWPSNEFNLPKCSKCGCNSKDATYGHKNNFCHKCGRAMNDAAWEMLQKRLEGRK